MNWNLPSAAPSWKYHSKSVQEIWIWIALHPRNINWNQGGVKFDFSFLGFKTGDSLWHNFQYFKLISSQQQFRSGHKEVRCPLNSGRHFYLENMSSQLWQKRLPPWDQWCFIPKSRAASSGDPTERSGHKGIRNQLVQQRLRGPPAHGLG